MHSPRVITAQTARRLAISRQRLTGPRPEASTEKIMELFADLGCVQIDPVRVVEKTQLLVLHSRLKKIDPALLDRLLWEERLLFEYWAHAASIVRMADFPIFGARMRWWQERMSGWNQRVNDWLSSSEELRQYILDELAANGPLSASELAEGSARSWESPDWTSVQSIGVMLDDLWSKGQVLVATRDNGPKRWDISERLLPPGAWEQVVDLPEAVSLAAQRSLRALGVGTARHIRQHFTRNGYPDLAQVLKGLEKDGLIRPVAIADGEARRPGKWYVHCEDEALIDELEAGQWQPRTVLLSPFDNLICDRRRTEELLDFHYRVEIYVPKAKRKYGNYVMPILHGDRLIGRLDPKMDRQNGRLEINAVYAEPDAPRSKSVARAIRAAVEDLAGFLGADDVNFGEETPAFWRPILS
jgi:uncharacterized protein